MGWIGIGVGLVTVGLSSFGLIQNRLASTILLVIAAFLICNGAYEMWGKQRMFLKRRIQGWLLKANWSVEIEEKPGFCFIIWAKDECNREVGITREKKRKDILAFTALVKMEMVRDWDLKLAGLNDTQKHQLMEDIKVFLASMDVAYDRVTWPLEKVTVQNAVLLDNNISGYIVDLKAKSIVNAVIGVRSIIRKAIAC
jgi:hypothetical protein